MTSTPRRAAEVAEVLLGGERSPVANHEVAVGQHRQIRLRELQLEEVVPVLGRERIGETHRRERRQLLLAHGKDREEASVVRHDLAEVLDAGVSVHVPRLRPRGLDRRRQTPEGDHVVDGVAAEVRHLAAAGLPRRVEALGPEVGEREVVRERHTEAVGMVDGLPVLPVPHVREQLRRHGMEAHGDDVVDELHVVAFDGSLDPAGRLEALAERLVQKDVLPGGGGLLDPVSLVAGIAAEGDNVDRRIADQGVRIRSELDSQRPCERGGAARIHLPACDELGAGLLAEGVDDELAVRAAVAEHPDPISPGLCHLRDGGDNRVNAIQLLLEVTAPSHAKGCGHHAPHVDFAFLYFQRGTAVRVKREEVAVVPYRLPLYSR